MAYSPLFSAIVSYLKSLTMNAKFLLTKALGTACILTGLLFLISPQALLNFLGLGFNPTDLAVVSFIVRLIAVRNIVGGVALLLVKDGIYLHFWLWASVVGAFGDALSALALNQDASWRYLIPLWAAAIFELFAVGVAYGLDIAKGWGKTRTPVTPPPTSESTPIPDAENTLQPAEQIQ